MKKTLFLVFLILTGISVLGLADEALEKKIWDVFVLDHKDFKNAVSTIKIQKKLGNMFEGYYDEKNTFTPSAGDLATGYALFRKATGEALYPNNLPSKEDLIKELSVSAVSGEFEPFMVCVLPFENLIGVNVAVTDLVSGSNKKIPKENIDIKHIKYEYMKAGIEWIVKGRYLIKGPADAINGVVRGFRLTVKVPENAEPGIYKGKATVIVPGKKNTELPVSLEVLPFKWAEFSKDHTYWMWYYHGYPENAELEKHLINLRDHGMNCFESNTPVTFKIEGENIKLDFAIADRVLPLLKKYGFTKWMFGDHIHTAIAEATKLPLWDKENVKLFKSLLVQFKEKAKKDNWPDTIWTVDEPREFEDTGRKPFRAYLDMLNFFKIFNELQMMSNASWGYAGGGKRADDPGKTLDFTELVPLSYYNTTYAPNPGTEKIITTANKLKKPLFLYNCGPYRFSFGILVKQKNALGNSQFWWAAADYGIPTTGEASSSCAVKGPEGIIDTLEWEQIREGVDDYKYIWTLDQMLSKCADKNSAEAKAAEAAINKVMKLGFKEGGGSTFGTDFMADGMKDFKASLLDDIRADVIKAILGLQKAK